MNKYYLLVYPTLYDTRYANNHNNWWLVDSGLPASNHNNSSRWNHKSVHHLPQAYVLNLINIYIQQRGEALPNKRRSESSTNWGRHPWSQKERLCHRLLSKGSIAQNVILAYNGLLSVCLATPAGREVGERGGGFTGGGGPVAPPLLKPLCSPEHFKC